jgi:hypothetical protein
MEPSNTVHEHDHERTDVPVRTIGKFLLGLTIGGIVVVLILAALWRLFAAMQPEPTVTAWRGPREFPPGPRLQTAPVLDRINYQEEEMKRLNTYGWVDQSAGRVHIPIEEAMKLLVQRGYEAKPQ